MNCVCMYPIGVSFFQVTYVNIQRSLILYVSYRKLHYAINICLHHLKSILRTFDPAFCPNFCIYLLESYFISLRKFRITTPIELYSINPCSHQTSYFFLMMVSRSQIADKIASIIEGARQLKDDGNRPFRAVSDRKLVQDFARALPKPCKLRDSRGTSVRNCMHVLTL